VTFGNAPELIIAIFRSKPRSRALTRRTSHGANRPPPSERAALLIEPAGVLRADRVRVRRTPVPLT
jgi:hypothetical protein